MAKPLVVFTYAPAGLGHIRVADALIEGLPEDYDSLVFSPPDPSIESIHRFSSLNRFARSLMEWIQQGWPQTIFTRYYRNYLKSHTSKLLLEFTSLIKTKPKIPKNIIIVSTHFGLAYQLGSIKNDLEKALNTKIFLVVQITDDSPQYIWYVDTADLIIAPSQQTADILIKYGRKEQLKKINFEVLPYPVLSLFSKNLSDSKVTLRLNQFNPVKNTPINIVVPISGAAVGTDFYIKLMDKLHNFSKRFYFHVVCRRAHFTKEFIDICQTKKYINLYASENYKEIIYIYNTVYLKNVISSEITKPSEQSFKALLDNDSVGGSFLFFANPVGRQEYDNLNFLKKNGLLTTNMRGVIIPKNPIHAADFIYNLYQNGFLLKTFKKFRPVKNNPDVRDNGSTLFWKTVLKYIDQ